jgi:hypothetical protein
MKTFLLGKHYPEEIVDAAIEKAAKISRSQALLNAKKDDQQILPLVITYGETSEKLSHSIKQLYKTVVVKDMDLRSALPPRPLTAYRRPKNLRDLLVRATLNQTTAPRPLHQNPGTIPCKAKKCLTCKHVALQKEIVGTQGVHKIRDQFSCKSRCVIYAITCKKCSAIYIGQTKRCLFERFREHLYGLTREPLTAVGEHFTQTHSRDDMQVTAIQAAPQNEQRRLELESRIIFKLGTNQRPGLNTDFQLI